MISEEHLGSKIEILLYDNNNELKNNECYVSQIEGIVDDVIFNVAFPLFEGKYVPLHIKQKVQILLYTKQGLFGFDSEVLEREKGVVPLLVLKRISKISKIQRRQFFRYQCALPFQYKLLIEPNAMDGVIKDISGGGIRFITTTSLSQGEKIVCMMNLNDEEIRCIGEILRVLQIEQGNYHYEMHVKFIRIQDQDQEKIIKYIFDEQRKTQKRQKGLMS